MSGSLGAAMKLLEARRLDEAERALAPLCGPSGDGVIARFRRAEALSRLGRHDEAVAEATQAAADAPDTPPAPLWLAWTLAEAGRLDEAAAVELPTDGKDEVASIREGFRALARLPAGSAGLSTEEAAAAVGHLLEARHHPLLSLGLRLAEEQRLTGDVRTPDIATVYYLACGVLEADDEVVSETVVESLGRGVRRSLFGASDRDAQRTALDAELPPPDGSAPIELLNLDRLLALTAAKGGWAGVHDALEPWIEPMPDELEQRFEVALFRNDIAAAQKALDAMIEDDGKEPRGEIALATARLAHLRGEAVSPAEIAGFKGIHPSLRSAVDWLIMNYALLANDPAEARRRADTLAGEPDHEFVTGALYRWAVAGVTAG